MFWSNSYELFAILQFDTSRADGQYRKPASNAKLLNLIGDFKFTPFEQGWSIPPIQQVCFNWSFTLQLWRRAPHGSCRIMIKQGLEKCQNRSRQGELIVRRTVWQSFCTVETYSFTDWISESDHYYYWVNTSRWVICTFKLRELRVEHLSYSFQDVPGSHSCKCYPIFES